MINNNDLYIKHHNETIYIVQFKPLLYSALLYSTSTTLKSKCILQFKKYKIIVLPRCDKYLLLLRGECS